MAEEVRAEGWGWVEIQPDLPYAELIKFDVLPLTQRELSEEEKALCEALQEQEQDLCADMDMLNAEDEEKYEKLNQQLEAIQEKYKEIEEATKKYDAEAMKQAGAIITLEYPADVMIHRGLIRPLDKTEGMPAEQESTDEKTKQKPIHSEKLMRRLSAHRSTAMQAVLASQPDIALTTIVHHLASEIFYWMRNGSVVHIRAETFEDALSKEADDLKGSLAWQTMETERACWKKNCLPLKKNYLIGYLSKHNRHDSNY